MILQAAMVLGIYIRMFFIVLSPVVAIPFIIWYIKLAKRYFLNKTDKVTLKLVIVYISCIILALLTSILLILLLLMIFLYILDSSGFTIG